MEELKGRFYLVFSKNGKTVFEHETGKSIDYAVSLSYKTFDNDDLSAPIASGSFSYSTVIIIPASMNTTAKIASGISDNLITRVAAVSLKERRKLIVVPRETPLSTINLKNMTAISEAGGMIMPAMPSFYNLPETKDDVIDMFSGRVMSIMGIKNRLYREWGSQ